MFNKPLPSTSPQNNPADRGLADRKQPSVIHTPGIYPPLSARNEPASAATTATAAHAAAPVSPPAAKLDIVLDDDVSNAVETTGSRLIVGPDVKLKGAEILDCDTLVVEGRVEATMDSRVMRITERGAFSGKVCIDIAEVYGLFEGELTARQQLIIHATGHVKGKIRYGKLLIEAGGVISGEVESIAEQKVADAKTQNPVLNPAQNLNVKPMHPAMAAG